MLQMFSYLKLSNINYGIWIADAGVLAGLNLLSTMTEPTAAAIANASDKKATNVGEWNILVVSLGAGTFDVSLLTIREGIFGVKPTPGDIKKDFGNSMVNHFVPEFNENSLRYLISCERTNWRNFEKYLIDAKILRNVLSGTTKTQVQQLDFNCGEEHFKSINLNEVVTYVVAVQGATLSGEDNEKFQDLILLDVTPLSLALETDESVIILRKPEFSSFSANQPGALIQVYVGEKTRTSKTNLFDKFELSGNPPSPSGTKQIVDARPRMPFLDQEFQDVSKELIRPDYGKKHVDEASGGNFDIKPTTSELFKSLVGRSKEGPTKAMLTLPPAAVNTGPRSYSFPFSAVPRLVLVVKVPDRAIFQIYIADNATRFNLDGGVPDSIFQDRLLAEERDFNILNYDFEGWLLMGYGNRFHYLNLVTGASVCLPNVTPALNVESLKGVFNGEPGTNHCKTVLICPGLEEAVILYHEGGGLEWFIFNVNLWAGGTIAALCLFRDILYLINNDDGAPYCIYWNGVRIDSTRGLLELPGFVVADNERLVSFVERDEELLLIVIQNLAIRAYQMFLDASFDHIVQVQDWMDSGLHIYAVNKTRGRVFPSPPFPAQGQVTMACRVNNVECMRFTDEATRILKSCEYPTHNNRCNCSFAWISA